MLVQARCVPADLDQTESRVCYAIDEIRLKSPLVPAEKFESSLLMDRGVLRPGFPMISISRTGFELIAPCLTASAMMSEWMLLQRRASRARPRS